MAIDPRPTLTAPDDDPYLWLEEIEGAQALAWVEAQNQATLASCGDVGYRADREVLTAILDRPDNLPYVRRRGGHLYNFWQDAEHPRGLWRRTTLAGFVGVAPDWEVLLDLDALAGAEGEDWIWQGASTLRGGHERAMVRLSRGGADAVVLREFDLTECAMVADGFVLPEAKGGVDWLDRDTLLLSSAYGDDMATRSAYPRTVRLWHRGEPPERAAVLFTTDAARMAVWGGVDHDVDGEQIWFSERLSFYDSITWLGDRTGPTVRLELPDDAVASFHRGWLAVRPRRPWTVGGRTFPPDTLLGIGLARFLAGERDFEVLFEPAARRSLRYVFWCDGDLLVALLDDLAPVFERLTPGPDGWARQPFEGLPEISVANLSPLDVEESESNGDLIASIQDPLTPPTLLLLAPGKAPVTLKRAPAVFRADGLVTSRHEAISVDGERIPYVQVGPPALTGDAPVHLSGYGGFLVSQLPYYRTAIGKLWLERGGTAVTANIRGGGEFGSPWHEAGRREGKRLSHDDFAAIAADLVTRGVTRPERIAAEGGSNGGILITNMLVRYPERFGALFCTIPLVDMRRYPKLLAGASWIDEYGDPDNPDDWAFLGRYSAYHLAAPGQTYPPILLATTRKDDRVHPGHARKMAAKLQAMGYRAWFYEPAAGGHGYGKDHAEQASFIALGFSFLRQAIGWTDGGGAAA